MDKKRYIMPLVAVMELRSERLMGFANTSSDKSFPGYAPSRERIVTTAY